MYISLYLAELPFLVSSIPYQAILISDSESPWKNGFKWYMYHTIWCWITFFGLIHTILGNSDIRFWISLTNPFLMIFTSSDFAELPFFFFLALSIPYQTNTDIRFRISLKKWYTYHTIWLNYLFWPHAYQIEQFQYQILNLIEKLFLLIYTLLYYHFWPYLYHIRQFWYKILNLLINCFPVACRPCSKA